MVRHTELARGARHMDGPRERLRGNPSIGGLKKDDSGKASIYIEFLSREKLACM